MIKNTRVYISGASGNLGSEIVLRLKANPEIEVIGLKRDSKDSYVDDLLNRENELSTDQKLLIHCGWDVSNRKIESQYKSAIETESLARICKLRDIQFIFMSSASASKTSISNYGKMKFIAENTVLDTGGLVLRPGLVLFDTAQGLQKVLLLTQKLFLSVRFYPDVTISTIRINLLCEKIVSLVKGSKTSYGIVQINNQNISLNSLCESRRVMANFSLVIPLTALSFILKVFGKVNTRAAALHDSLSAVFPQ